MNARELYERAVTGARQLDTLAGQLARADFGGRVFSRGFEFLSLDANEERDENVVDYCDRGELSVALIERMAADCRAAGSSYLAIGYGVDAADSAADYDVGDYEPMYDWIDFPNLAV